MQTLMWMVRKRPLGVVGGLVVLFWLVVAVFSNHIAPYDPSLQGWRPLLPPGPEHLMGTDGLGRDLLSRVIYGSRISIAVGLGTITITFFLSLGIGIFSTFVGGIVDLVLQRIVDALMSFPSLLFAMFLANLLGQNLLNVIIAITVIRTVHGIRIVRSLVLSEKEKEYVAAAQVVGSTSLRICLRHLSPNIIPLVIVIAAGAVGDAILAEATLSFMGLGIPAPTPSWGGELGGDAQTFYLLAPWLVIFPGLALSSAVLGFNNLGDALRDAIDPWLRRGRGE